MNRFILLAFLSLGCSTLIAQNIDTRNYAVGTYDANTNEIRIAELKARRYWQQNRQRLGEKGRYLAITAAAVLPGDVVQPLWHNLVNAQTGSGFLLPSAWNNSLMRCIMIYDTTTSRFVSSHGVLAIEKPLRGRLARFDDHIALFIDTGSFW